MEIKKHFKVISVLLSLVIVLALFEACSIKPENTESNENRQNSQMKPDEPANRETSPITLTVFVNSPGEFAGMEASEVGKEILARTGVTLDFRFATTKEGQELTALMASNDLPDFVRYTIDSSFKTTLWKQGYLEPINKLMDEYARSMWDIMPADMDKFYTEPDGNIYLIPTYYSDIEKVEKIKGNSTTQGAFVMHKPIYDALGAPDIATLDQYKSLLLQVKEKYSDKFSFLVYDGSIADATKGTQNMAQLINRMYGGTNFKNISSDGTTHMNFRDESYKKAILFINDLYRSGLFNPENFTATSQFTELAKNEKIFSYWGQSIAIIQQGDMTIEEKRIYHSYEPPREAGVTPKLESGIAKIGWGSGTSISSTSKNKERAILFLEFLLSEEGQMLTYHGIEGVHYNIVEGMPKNTEYKNNAWLNDRSDMVNKMGIMGAFNWIPLLETDAKYYYWLNKDVPAYLEISDINDKYASNERINVITTVESDTDEKVIENKIIELWNNSMPKMLLADSVEACVSAYETFIKEAEAIGLSKLEAAYTANAKYWLEKLK